MTRRKKFRDGIPAAALKRFGFGGKNAFLEHKYTRQAPESGYLMTFVSSRVREIGKPKPDGFRFRPNGWGRYVGDL